MKYICTVCTVFCHNELLGNTHLTTLFEVFQFASVFVYVRFAAWDQGSVHKLRYAFLVLFDHSLCLWLCFYYHFSDHLL